MLFSLSKTVPIGLRAPFKAIWFANSVCTSATRLSPHAAPFFSFFFLYFGRYSKTFFSGGIWPRFYTLRCPFSFYFDHIAKVISFSGLFFLLFTCHFASPICLLLHGTVYCCWWDHFFPVWRAALKKANLCILWGEAQIAHFFFLLKWFLIFGYISY